MTMIEGRKKEAGVGAAGVGNYKPKRPHLSSDISRHSAKIIPGEITL